MSSEYVEPTQEQLVTAEGASLPSAPDRIRYVDVPIPTPSEPVEIAPGVLWTRLPLPIDLNHINLWLIDVGDGYVCIDSGMSAQMCKAAWEHLESGLLRDKPLRGLFITHVHPDHIGLARWIQDRSGAAVWMSEDSLQLARSVYVDRAPRAEDIEVFLRTHGVSDIEGLKPMFTPERFSRMNSGLPRAERYIEDGELLRWGSTAWRVLRTDGHAQGHLCLHESELNVLVSGDQVLPTISSNISVMLQRSDQNPLQAYLLSLDRLRELPIETLVLPSHGRPFYGLQQRIVDLQRHHEEQLSKLLIACGEPKCAHDVLRILFRRELAGMHLFLALGEAVAHLEYLARQRRLERVSTGGVTRYSRC